MGSSELPSRAEAVRLAIGHLLEQRRPQRLGAAIVEDCRRLPQAHDEVAVAEAQRFGSIHDEPW